MGDSNSHADGKTDKFLTKLNEYAVNIAKKEGYVSYNLEMKNVSSDGGGYIGALYEINIKGKTGTGDKETNAFVKNMVDANMEMIYSVPTIFEREYFVYSDLAKLIDELQNERNVPVGDRYMVPKAFDECNPKTIILENLIRKGFKTYHRMNVLNLEYAELAVKNLARLHGLTFALQKCRPDYFNKYIENMDCAYNYDENWRGFTENMKTVAYPFLNADVRKRVENKLSDIVKKYHSYMRDENCIRTICHGDYRHNNVMVKEVNGKPTEVIAVDYQITHYGNPVIDFFFFIFFGTDQNFRREHLTYLKDLYHQHLGVFLIYFDIDVEEVYPKTYYERQYKEKLDFGAMMSVFYLPFLFPPEDDIPDLMNTTESLSDMTVKVDKKYGERFRGIIDDFIQWGYL